MIDVITTQLYATDICEASSIKCASEAAQGASTDYAAAGILKNVAPKFIPSCSSTWPIMCNSGEHVHDLHSCLASFDCRKLEIFLVPQREIKINSTGSNWDLVPVDHASICKWSPKYCAEFKQGGKAKIYGHIEKQSAPL